MKTDIDLQQFAHRAQQYMHYLCDELGARPSASPNHHAASEYIEKHFQSCGFKVESQEWDSPDWQELETILQVNGEILPAAANAFSPCCDVTAPLEVVRTMAELEKAEITGRIVILCGALALHPLSPKKWFLASEQELHMIDLLENKAPAAVVTVQSRPGNFVRLIEDDDFNIPSVTVPPEVGRVLVENMDLAAHLAINTQSKPGKARNLVARLGNKDQPRMVICAHYDTKIDTPGATDNASGITVLLCLADYFKNHPPSCALEFVAFGSEEYLPIGDDIYLASGGETLLPNLKAAINIDGIGSKLGVNSIAMFSESAAFHTRMEEICLEFPALIWTGPWPESNHSTFAWRGVPSIAFTARGGPNFYHLHQDTLDWVDMNLIAEVVAIILRIIADGEDRKISWFRQEISQKNPE